MIGKTSFLLLLFVGAVLPAASSTSSAPADEDGRKIAQMVRTVSDLTAVSHLRVSGNLSAFSLARITFVLASPFPQGYIDDNSQIHQTADALGTLNGNITLLALSDVKKVLATKIFEIKFRRASREREDMLAFSPYTDKTPTYAVCHFAPNASAEIVNQYPETYLIPESWLADVGSAIATSETKTTGSDTGLAKAPRFSSPVALIAYAARLASADEPRYRAEFGGLLSQSDLYSGAFVTNLLLNPKLGDASDGIARLMEIIPSVSDPKILEAIALGILVDVRGPHPPSSKDRSLVELLKAKISSAPNTNKETSEIISAIEPLLR